MEPLPGTKVPSVVVALANTGTLICKPILSVALTSPGGSGRTVSRQLDSVLPGTKVEFPLPWPVALDAGRYGVTATSKRCGKPSSVTTMAKLGTTLRGTPAAPDPAPPVVIVKHASIPWPALLGSTGLAALLGGFLVALVVRRRRPRPAAA